VKGPLAVTVLGVAVVVAAIVVNEAYSPDSTSIMPPNAPPTAGTPAVGATDTPTVTIVRNEKAQPDGGPVFDLVRVAPDGHTVIAGQAEPGSRVVIFDGDTPLGEVIADGRGEWVFLPPAPLQPGEHRLELVAQAPDRPTVLSRDVIIVIVPEFGPELIQERGEDTAGPSYTIIYEANRDDIQNPDLIDPGQVLVLPEL
jgi:hypothetical protein